MSFVSAALRRRPHLVQFIKYCTVGLSNFSVDAAISYALTFGLHLQPLWLPNTISFVTAATNSFYWNRRWTFAAASRDDVHRKYLLFVAINTVGLGIELGVMQLVFWLFATCAPLVAARLVWACAKIAATAVVVAWNFSANKRFTFKV
jgi:putative flippase GtrA